MFESDLVVYYDDSCDDGCDDGCVVGCDIGCWCK
jgi:hypothetical protein